MVAVESEWDVGFLVRCVEERRIVVGIRCTKRETHELDIRPHFLNPGDHSAPTLLF